MITGSYNYPGVHTSIAINTNSPIGYGNTGNPLAVAIVSGSAGGGGASTGTSTIIAFSGAVIEQSSSFTGNAYVVVLNATDCSQYADIALTLINNSTNIVASASVEWSPNNTQWETTWDTTSFAGLAANGAVRSMQILGNSRRYLRVRAIPGGTLTGSLDVFLNVRVGG